MHVQTQSGQNTTFLPTSPFWNCKLSSCGEAGKSLNTIPIFSTSLTWMGTTQQNVHLPPAVGDQLLPRVKLWRWIQDCAGWRAKEKSSKRFCRNIGCNAARQNAEQIRRIDELFLTSTQIKQMKKATVEKKALILRSASHRLRKKKTLAVAFFYSGLIG